MSPRTTDNAPKRGAYRPQRKRQPYGPPPAFRKTRGNVKHLQLQPRDFALLTAVLENRVLTQDLLAWLFPPDPEATPEHLTKRNEQHGKRSGTNLGRRLAKLFHEGYVERVRTVYAGPLIYALADKGAELLRGELSGHLVDRRAELEPKLAAKNWREKNRALSQQYLNHALMIARVNAALTVATPFAGLSFDTFQRDGKTLKIEWSTPQGRRAVIPDALVRLVDPTRPAGQNALAFCLEADQSTMHSDRMSEKFSNYAKLATTNLARSVYGVDRFRVLVVTKSAGRAQNLAQLVAGAYIPPKASKPMPSPVPEPSGRKLFFFTSEDQFTEPKHFLSTVWQRGDDPAQRVAIIPQPIKRSP